MGDQLLSGLACGVGAGLAAGVVLLAAVRLRYPPVMAALRRAGLALGVPPCAFRVEWEVRGGEPAVTRVGGVRKVWASEEDVRGELARACRAFRGEMRARGYEVRLTGPLVFDDEPTPPVSSPPPG